PAPEAAQRAPGAEADVGTPGAEVSPTLFPRLIASTDHAPAPKVASTRHPPRIIRLASQPGAWGPVKKGTPIRKCDTGMEPIMTMERQAPAVRVRNPTKTAMAPIGSAMERKSIM